MALAWSYMSPADSAPSNLWFQAGVPFPSAVFPLSLQRCVILSSLFPFGVLEGPRVLCSVHLASPDGSEGSGGNGGPGLGPGPSLGLGQELARALARASKYVIAQKAITENTITTVSCQKLCTISCPHILNVCSTCFNMCIYIYIYNP